MSHELKKVLYIVKGEINPDFQIEKGTNVVYALDNNARKTLSKKNIMHKTSNHILNLLEMETIDSLAVQISTNWYNNPSIKNKITINDINLGFLVELEVFSYLLGNIKEIFLINKIFKIENPQEIIICGDIPSAKSLVEKYNITYKIIGPKSMEARFHMDTIYIKYDVFGHLVVLKLSFKRFLWLREKYEKTIRLLLNFTRRRPNKNNKKKNVLLLEFNPAIYSDLLYAAKNSDVNLKLLNLRRPPIWNLDSYKKIRRSDSEILISDDYLIDKKTIAEKIDLLLKELNLLFTNDEVFHKQFSINDNSFWPYIKNDFHNFCISRFSEAIKEIEMANNLFDSQRIDSILTWGDNLQVEKTILSVGKQRGIFTLVLQHGVIAESISDVTHPYNRINAIIPLVAEHYASWGKIIRNHLIRMGMNPDNVIDIGSPKFDSHFKRIKKNPSKKRILLATSGLGSSSVSDITDDIIKKYEESIKTVCRAVKKLDDYELIVKLHPYATEFINVKDIVKNIDPAIEVSQNTDLMELIESSDIVITFAMSTVLLESLIKQKPTVDIWFYDNLPSKETIFKYDAIILIKYEDLEKTLNQILNDATYIKEKLENGKKLINDYFSNQGTAAIKLLEFMKNMSSNKQIS